MKRINSGPQAQQRNLKTKQHNSTKVGVNSGVPEGLAPLVARVVLLIGDTNKTAMLPTEQNDRMMGINNKQCLYQYDIDVNIIVSLNIQNNYYRLTCAIKRLLTST